MTSSRYAVLAASALAASLGGCGLLINYSDYTAGAGGSGTATGTGGGATATGSGGQGGAAVTASVNVSASASASSGDTSSSTGQGGSGGGAGCGTPDDVCFAPPSGWSGPWLYNPTDKECISGWQTQEMDTEYAIACTCSCGPSPATCASVVSLYTDSACTQPVQSIATTGGCVGLGPTMALGIDVVATPQKPPVCPPFGQGISSKLPVSLCSPVAAMPCATGTCAPPPSMGGYCVAHPDDVSCPAGFAIKHILGGIGAVDGRICDAGQCVCAGATGSCNVQTTLWTSSPACGGAASGVISGSGCTGVVGALESLQVDTKPSFTCLAGGTSTPMGTVMGPKVQTVCCSN